MSPKFFIAASGRGTIERMIDTAKVAGRRELSFNSIDELLAECERIAAAERTGQLQCLGNWTVGQVFNHLATWAEFAYKPNPLKPPLPIKLILRMMKTRFIRGPMKVGAHIPNVDGGTLGTETCSTEDGLNRLRAIMTRLTAEQPSEPNVIFGRLSHEEWISMHLRHAELHLSFLKC
jgi:hypothetical protein